MYNKTITKIKGLSERRRLPRLGKLRLGIKKKSAKGVEYPAETEYFVCPPEVQKVYGEKPTCLDVLFPVEDTNVLCPQSYQCYGAGKGLKCVGDGEVALRLNEKSQEMEEMDCPCERLGADCKQRMNLRFILPRVNVGGIYEIPTSSINSIIDVNSGIDYVRALVGRIAFVPLKLKRVATETHHEGKKQIHYTLKLELEADINFVNTLRENTSRILVSSSQYSLPAPILENPAIDEGVTVVTVDEEPNQVPDQTPPSPREGKKQDAETKDYIAKIIFPKLKECFGITTKEQAEKRLYGYCKIAKYEDLDMKQAEDFFIHLQEKQDEKLSKLAKETGL